MSTEGPSHGLYIKWGRFQMGASGVPALVTLMLALAIVLLGRILGAW